MNSQIIFITSHPECRNDIFYSRLLALDYITKLSNWQGRLEETIKYIINKIKKEDILIFEYNHNTYRIPFKEINYVEKIQDNQKCIIRTINENYEIISTLNEMLKKLGDLFFKTHKSCIVNISNIKEINYKENSITFTNGNIIYLLASKRKKELKEYVSNY